MIEAAAKVGAKGIVSAGTGAGDNLQPWKARLLLALTLTKTTNADEIQRMIDTYSSRLRTVAAPDFHLKSRGWQRFR